MKIFKHFLMACMLLTACVSFTSCDKDDDNTPADIATAIAGDYSGMLELRSSESPFNNDPIGTKARAYVTFARKAENAVACDIICEDFGFNWSNNMLYITKDGGTYEVASTNSTYSGSITNNSLYMSIRAYDTYGYLYVYIFSGSK